MAQTPFLLDETSPSASRAEPFRATLLQAARHFGSLIAVALVYYGSARLGLLLAFPGTNASAVWPPAGIALAACLLLGRRIWPAIMLAALVANLPSFLGSDHSLAMALVMAAIVGAGNTGEAALSAYVIGRWCRGDLFWNPQGVCRFAGAVALGSIVAASLGTLCLFLSGVLRPHDAAFVWWTWWLGDTAGMAIVTPFLLAWSRESWKRKRVFEYSFRSRTETFALAALTWTTGALIFGVWPFAGGTIYPVTYLAIPPLVWAAFRFGRRGATATLLILSGLAVWGTTHGSGPFFSPNLSASLLLLQTFMGVLAVTVLILSSALFERERDEAALRQARNQLEVRVQERTAELQASHRQVQESYAHLQELEALRDSLTHMIFHDLRTPLNALNYLLQMLDSEELSAHGREIVGLARQSGQTSSDIIGDLLDIHRIETGGLSLKYQPVSASYLVESALSQIRPMATYKGVAVSGEVAPDLPLARADSQKMTRVLVNLLDNALRFTPEGGTITLSARRHDNFVLLEVRDSGEGIAPERLERMFHKFGHVTSDDPDYRVSSGLGLTFCKLIVQEHGGTIGVQSKVGQGSVFSVSLPLHHAPKA